MGCNMKKECHGCLNLIPERDDDGSTRLVCRWGYSTKEGSEKCHTQEYKED